MNYALIEAGNSNTAKPLFTRDFDVARKKSRRKRANDKIADAP